MKTGLTIKALALSVLCATTGLSWASGYENYAGDNLCGCWGLQVKAGVAPVIWTDRCCSVISDCAAVLTPGLLSGGKVGKFDTYFHNVPWTVGLELDYNWTECIGLYGDFQYRQARGRTACTPITLANGGIPIVSFDHYKSFSFYFGGDYHFDDLFGLEFCEGLSFFVGIKVGFTVYGKLNACLIPPSAVGPTVRACVNSRTVFSGGGRFGADYCFCENLSIVFTAEILGQSGHQLGCLSFPVVSGIPGFRFGSVGTEVVFPMTLGLRYAF